jgi:hypothetical protein
VKFAFIAAREVAFPVSAICRVLGVTNSGFYAWKKRPKPERVLLDARLAATVAAVHHRSRRTYGSPRVYRELKARGVRVGKKRVERLMRENGLQGRSKRRYKRATDSRHGGPIAPNLLARQFDCRRCRGSRDWSAPARCVPPPTAPPISTVTGPGFGADSARGLT